MAAQTVDINWDDYNAGLRAVDIVWRQLEEHAIAGTLDDERFNVIEREFIDSLKTLTLPQRFSEATRRALMLLRGNDTLIADLAERAQARGVGTPAETDFREMAKRLY
jgi:hypothetical protein